MARVNVFLAEDLLETVDAEAREAGTSRSALIQQALLEYLELRRKRREEAEAQPRMDEACKRMDDLAQRLGPWEPVGVIRSFRDTRSRGTREPAPRPRSRKRR